MLRYLRLRMMQVGHRHTEGVCVTSALRKRSWGDAEKASGAERDGRKLHGCEANGPEFEPAQ